MHWLEFWTVIVLLNTFVRCQKEKNYWCARNENHILCPSRSPATCPKDMDFFPQTEVHKEEILRFFNLFRNTVARGRAGKGLTDGLFPKHTNLSLPRASKMPQLVWCKECERAATYVVNNCKSHRTILCEGLNINEMQVKIVSASYTMDSKKYPIDRKNPNFEGIIQGGIIIDQMKTDPFSNQVFNDPNIESSLKYNFIPFLLNDKISRVGCAISIQDKYGLNSIEVHCAFGSVVGMIHQPLYEAGTPCSKCPMNSGCSRTYPSLCKCTETTCMPPSVSAEAACRVPGNGMGNLQEMMKYMKQKGIIEQRKHTSKQLLLSRLNQPQSPRKSTTVGKNGKNGIVPMKVFIVNEIA